MSATNKPHVVVLAFPFGTHAAPLLSLVCRLAAANPAATFSFFSTSSSNGKIFSSIKDNDRFHNINPYNVEDGVPEGHVFSGYPLEAMELFLKAAPDNFRKAISGAVEERDVKVTCLLTDAFFWFGKEISEELNVPWIALWTASPCALSIHTYTDLLRERLSGEKRNSEETIDFIPGMSRIRAKDVPEDVVGENRKAPFSCMLHNMGRTIPNVTALAINSFEELDPTITNDLKSKIKSVLSVGPFNLSSPPPPSHDENGCITWLDKQKPSSVAYICFGTTIMPPPNELTALAEALAAKEVPFLWSFRDNSKLHLLEEFLGKEETLGKVVPWSPQKQVLEHQSVGVFVTHAGWNSIMESIAGGVPLICRPFFGDQGLNSRLIDDVWKIGVTLEGGKFTKEGTIKALEVVLGSEEGKAMRENIRVLKEKAEKAVEDHGSSTENFGELLKEVLTSS